MKQKQIVIYCDESFKKDVQELKGPYSESLFCQLAVQEKIDRIKKERGVSNEK